MWPVKSYGGLNPGGSLNFVCTEVCGHITGKLNHPQTEVGLSINENGRIPRLCTIKHEPKWLNYSRFYSISRKYPFPSGNIEMVTSLEVLCIRIMTHPQALGQKFSPIHRQLGTHSGCTSPVWPIMGCPLRDWILLSYTWPPTTIAENS